MSLKSRIYYDIPLNPPSKGDSLPPFEGGQGGCFGRNPEERRILIRKAVLDWIHVIHHSIAPLLRLISSRYVAFTLLGMMAIVPAIAEACPGCNAAMDNTVGRGFNMSVLFLMGMPFFVFGSIAVGIFFVRRNQQRREQSDS